MKHYYIVASRPNHTAYLVPKDGKAVHFCDYISAQQDAIRRQTACPTYRYFVVELKGAVEQQPQFTYREY